MGNPMEKIAQSDDGKKKNDDIFDLKKIYWDADGNLRHGFSDRNRDAEVLKLL